MNTRNFFVGGTAAFATMLLVLVSLFAAYKKAPAATTTDSVENYKPREIKAEGPYASVEHFCDAGACPL